MKPKQTRGPWQVYPPFEDGDPYTIGAGDGLDNVGLIRREGDARVVAAAPELLAWTIELLKQVKRDNPDKLEGIVQHVEALIRRAGGSK
jgi:hypothetical protein